MTTVGYGDVVPSDTEGRLIGAVLMLQGIGFITVIAASVTAALIEQARKSATWTTSPPRPRTSSRSRRGSDAIERALGVETAADNKADEPDAVALSRARARP